MKRIGQLIMVAVRGFLNDNAFTLAAALAYYTLLSLAPLLVFLLLAVGQLGPDAQQQTVQRIETVFGSEAGGMIDTIMRSANTKHTLSSLPSIIGVIVLLIGATGVFVQLQAALNKIWKVKAKPGLHVGAWLRNRGMTFVMVILLGTLLLASLVLSTVLRYFLPTSGVWLRAGDLVGSLLLMTVLLAMLYKYLPDTIIDWRDVWVGALVTALLLALGRVGIRVYFQHSAVASAYGAASSLVLLLILIYYSAAMLFLGAELTQVYAQRRGQPIRPRAYALQVSTPAPQP